MKLERINKNLYRLEIPIPVPLKTVNAYLLKGSDGWCIIDTGFHDPETETVWKETLRNLGIGWKDITTIVVTHYHPDHYGASGWLQKMSGAEVLVSEKEREFLERNWMNRDYPDEISDFYEKYGMPPSITEGVIKEHKSRLPVVLPHPKIHWIKENEQIRLGPYEFVAIWTPGHTEGLMVLWEEQEKILVSNDMVLPKITPNISFTPRALMNPLQTYFDSMNKVRRLDATMTLPGHRDLIDDLQARIDSIRKHHEERLNDVREITKQLCSETGGFTSGWEVCLQLFGKLNEPVQHKFALAETLAHTEYLVHQGVINRKEEGPVTLYYI